MKVVKKIVKWDVDTSGITNGRYTGSFEIDDDTPQHVIDKMVLDDILDSYIFSYGWEVVEETDED